MRIDLTNDDFKILQKANLNISNSRIKQILRREQSFIWDHLLTQVKEEV